MGSSLFAVLLFMFIVAICSMGWIFDKIMAGLRAASDDPVLRLFGKKFRDALFRTTFEKWIDGVGIGVPLLWDLWFRPLTFWEGAEPCVVGLCGLCAVHAIVATAQSWRDIRKQPLVREVGSSSLFDTSGNKNATLISEPRPQYFQAKLLSILISLVAVLGLLSYAVRLAAVSSLRTFVYLVPTAELMECEKRAFFVRVEGPEVLYNVAIVLTDVKSGATFTQTYLELDPGQRSADIYFWFSPSSRWNEEYTVTVATREEHSNSRQWIVLYGVQHKSQLATQVTIYGEKHPVLSCRDNLIPDSYPLATGDKHGCDGLLTLPGDVPSQLDVTSYQRANGDLIIRKQRELARPSALDEQSDDRHITEYKRTLIEPTLRRYARSNVFIYFAGGDKTKAYAEEFRKMFRRAHWNTNIPTIVPVGDERIIDVQISIPSQPQVNPKAIDVWKAFDKAGIKQRKNLNLDQVAHGWIVLWVGPKSPNDVTPDQCLPADMKPVEGAHHTCDMVAVTDRGCPYPARP